MDVKLENRRARVFGASAGMGRAIAAALAREGASVCIAARDAGRLDQATSAVGAHASVVTDLTQPGAATQAVLTAAGKLGGGVEILVCNTGGPPKGGLHAISTAAWAESFQSLWMAVLDAVRAVSPAMQTNRWGRILLITSTSAREALPEMTVSNGLRAGLHGLVKSLSNELASHGITINALMPGYIDTDRLRQLGVKPDKVMHTVPAGRFGKPEEVGAVAAFLCSELASYITGQALAVDGGRLHSI